MVDYKGAIKRPFSDWRKLCIGALLYLIPFVNVITGLFASGYIFGCAKKTGKLPEWKNWKELFMKGLIAAVISILYFLPFLIISLLLFLLFGGEVFQGLINVNEIMPAIVISVLLFLLLIYISPMVLLHYINKFKFKDGFKINSIFKKSFTFTYLKIWLFCILYAIILGIIVGAIGSFFEVTIIIPIILNAFLSIVVGITIMTLYGQLWKKIK